jgi:hypothetical protein
MQMTIGRSGSKDDVVAAIQTDARAKLESTDPSEITQGQILEAIADYVNEEAADDSLVSITASISVGFTPA